MRTRPQIIAAATSVPEPPPLPSPPPLNDQLRALWPVQGGELTIWHTGEGDDLRIRVVHDGVALGESALTVLGRALRFGRPVPILERAIGPTERDPATPPAAWIAETIETLVFAQDGAGRRLCIEVPRRKPRETADVRLARDVLSTTVARAPADIIEGDAWRLRAQACEQAPAPVR